MKIQNNLSPGHSLELVYISQTNEQTPHTVRATYTPSV